MGPLNPKILMNAAQLPFLLKLLDDESPVVQEEVQRALISLAPELPKLFDDHKVQWPERVHVHRMLWHWRKSRLLSYWGRFNEAKGRHEALEIAHRNLSAYSSFLLESQEVPQRLDELAEQFRGQVQTPQNLADFLFSDKLQGDTKNYYSPYNSFVSRVLTSGRGNPITLCSIFILVAHRLGFPVWGCNFPGHFLAMDATDELVLYDCFHKGAVLGSELTPELRGQLSTAQIESVCRNPLSVEQFVMRILRNLVAAYLNEEKRTEANLFFLLQKDLGAREKGLGTGLALREPLFHPGQLVTHKSKGYRGVVVEYELYLEDESGPAHEPIYRILVHGSPQVASARESVLAPDKSGSLVAHPFVAYFFSKFEGGVYYRNAKPWEKS